MALVSYDYSDSENEDEADETTSSSCVVVKKNSQTSLITHKPPEENQGKDTDKPVEENTTEESSTPTKSSKTEISTTALQVESSLFSKLPESKKSTEVIEEDQIEDFIPRPKPAKVKEKVKISIPSLSEFADIEDDEPVAKKAKPSSKGSGLISLLPPVKSSVMSTKSFVPNVVANKSKATTPSSNQDKPSTSGSASALIPHAIRNQAEVKKTQLQKKPAHNENLESDDDEDMEIPETFDDEMWQKVCGRPKPKPVIIETPTIESKQPMITEPVNIAPEPDKPYDGLDNQAFKELVGRTKRPIGNIKLIDINEEDVLPEKELWMTKALTDPEMEPKKEIENPVDPTRRRKHHITYLAQQAKANEQELQNSWSSSKNNRMMSRAKYGF